jgi:hypothetical protein
LNEKFIKAFSQAFHKFPDDLLVVNLVMLS